MRGQIGGASVPVQSAEHAAPDRGGIMYSLKLSRGCLTIRPGDKDCCELWLNDQCIRECQSASEAAIVVASRQTGCLEVDHDDCLLPGNIDGWRWVSLFPRERRIHAVN
jgi:hypothetical protein